MKAYRFFISLSASNFFSHLHLQSSWLLIQRTLTHLHRLNRKTCTTFFFFFFVPFAKICDRFIHRQRQRFSPTFVFLWPITNLQQLLLLNRDFRRQQKLINNKSLWRKACSMTQQDENATRFRFKSYVRQVLLSVLVCLGLAKKNQPKKPKNLIGVQVMVWVEINPFTRLSTCYRTQFYQCQHSPDLKLITRFHIYLFIHSFIHSYARELTWPLWNITMMVVKLTDSIANTAKKKCI